MKGISIFLVFVFFGCKTTTNTNTALFSMQSDFEDQALDLPTEIDMHPHVYGYDFKDTSGKQVKFDRVGYFFSRFKFGKLDQSLTQETVKEGEAYCDIRYYVEGSNNDRTPIAFDQFKFSQSTKKLSISKSVKIQRVELSSGNRLWGKSGNENYWKIVTMQLVPPESEKANQVGNGARLGKFWESPLQVECFKKGQDSFTKEDVTSNLPKP